MQQPEVLGTAVSVNESGRPVLAVYVDRDAAKAGDVIRDLPKNVHGIDVQEHLTDKFRSMRGNPHGGSSHTAIQTPRFSLGPLEAGARTWRTVSAAAVLSAHSFRSAASNIS